VYNKRPRRALNFRFYGAAKLYSNIEYGVVDFGIVSDVELKMSTVKFSKTHNTSPKSIILSCQTYSYFYGTCIVDNSRTFNENEFTIALTPIQIGNGKGKWKVFWIALW
jgi:hypothetical protein